MENNNILNSKIIPFKKRENRDGETEYFNNRESGYDNDYDHEYEYEYEYEYTEISENEKCLQFQKTQFYHSKEQGAIFNRGVRVGDRIIIRPLFGRKKEIKLLHTLLMFEKEENRKLNQENSICGSQSSHEKKELLNLIKLPGLEGEIFSAELYLIYDKASIKNEDHFRYAIISTSEHFIRLNGVFIREALLERGDHLVIGHNEIIFVGTDFNDGKMKNVDEIVRGILGPNLEEYEKVLKSNATIVLTGETGTGKSKMAEKIHKISGRSGAFIHLNLNSFNSSLLESELFGHVKGAFTGAFNDKKGALREACNGTLFIDELDSLPKEIQTKLLLFLDSYKVRSVGGSGDNFSDVRIIVAALRNLDELVKKGEFREDFYYRITSGIEFKLPNLRERKDKLETIIKILADQEEMVIDDTLMKFYSKLKWFGNLRQLVSHLKRKKIFLRGRKLFFDERDDELFQNESQKIRNENRKIDLSLKNCTSELIFNSDIVTLKDLRIRYINKVYQDLKDYTMVSKVLAVSINTIKKSLQPKNNIN